MAQNLENVIRPFGTIDTAPKAGVASIPALAPDIVLVVNATGVSSGSITNVSFSMSVTLYMTKQEKELLQ